MIGLINMELVGIGDKIALWPLNVQNNGPLLETFESVAIENKIESRRFDQIITNSADYLPFRKRGLLDSFTVTCVSNTDLKIASQYYRALESGNGQQALFRFCPKLQFLNTIINKLILSIRSVFTQPFRNKKNFMSKLGTIIPLDDETRKLYSQYEMKYFLDIHLQENETSLANLGLMEAAYANELRRLKSQIKQNRRQALYFIDGQIRKCHSGGFLPSIFNLDESRGRHNFLDYDEVGRILATFEVWRKSEKSKIRRAKFWDFTIKLGALLGFASTLMQIITAIRPN